jgi:hypothetical protein
MRREKTQVTNIRKKRGEITTNMKAIQKIIIDYFESLYSTTLQNLEEMVRFLNTYDHPKLDQEDNSHLKRSITINEMEAAIKSMPKGKNPGFEAFLAEFQQTFKEELMSTLLKLFHNIKREGTLPNSFYEASITLIQKLNKDTSKKVTYRPVSLMNTNPKILNKIVGN